MSVLGKKDRFEAPLLSLPCDLVGSNRIIGGENRNAVFHRIPRVQAKAEFTSYFSLLLTAGSVISIATDQEISEVCSIRFLAS
jgi:hypothetical protein